MPSIHNRVDHKEILFCIIRSAISEWPQDVPHPRVSEKTLAKVKEKLSIAFEVTNYNADNEISKQADLVAKELVESVDLRKYPWARGLRDDQCVVKMEIVSLMEIHSVEPASVSAFFVAWR